jgi:MFS family permease
MVAVMTMTPVHLTHLGDSVTIIGITISLHVAGMYVLAPVVGWCVGWFGHRATIGIGVLGLAASCLVGALRPGDTSWVVVSLVLLGVGWSFVNVAASALFSGVVADAHRAQAQGGVDALANLCAAVAAFASGPLMAVTSFSALALVALALLVPLAVLTMTARLTAR